MADRLGHCLISRELGPSVLALDGRAPAESVHRVVLESWELKPVPDLVRMMLGLSGR